MKSLGPQGLAGTNPESLTGTEIVFLSLREMNVPLWDFYAIKPLQHHLTFPSCGQELNIGAFGIDMPNKVRIS